MMKKNYWNYMVFCSDTKTIFYDWWAATVLRFLMVNQNKCCAVAPSVRQG